MAADLRFLSGLDILYKDEDIAAVNKPPGLLSVPGRGADKADCAVSRAAAELGWIREVHRLDQATSGVLLLARNPVAHRRLCAAFAAREVVKTYLAAVPALPADPLVEGVVFSAGREVGTGQLTLRQRKDFDRPPGQLVDSVNGREAITLWRGGRNFFGLDLEVPGYKVHVLELTPLTGRTHQLRLAMATCGAPICGDGLYGPPEVAFTAPRLMLFAVSLEFEHPAGRRTMRITVQDRR
jgi:tRNA pseudouridine32 synthase/23S rRNA pseudouridine746 synthase